MERQIARIAFSAMLLLCAAVSAWGDSPRPWIQCPHGIAVSLVLSGHYIDVHVKNTSNQAIEFKSYDLFYLDQNGKRMPFKFYGDFRDDLDSPRPFNDMLAKGEELHYTTGILLNEHDASALMNSAVVCKMVVYFPLTKETIQFESPPKMLVTKK